MPRRYGSLVDVSVDSSSLEDAFYEIDSRLDQLESNEDGVNPYAFGILEGRVSVLEKDSDSDTFVIDAVSKLTLRLGVLETKVETIMLAHNKRLAALEAEPIGLLERIGKFLYEAMR